MKTDKKPWEPMTVKDVGNLREVIGGGTPKTSPAPGDPGEPNKNPVQETH